MLKVASHRETFFNYPEKYANSTINEAFGTDMSSVIENNEIDY